MKGIRLSNIIIMLIATLFVVYAMCNLAFAVKNIFTRPSPFASAPAYSLPTDSPDMATAPNQEQPYIVAREYNGMIGIFTERDAAAPERVLEVRVVTLPEYDQKLLRAGIHLKDERELAGFIEDYSS